MPRLRDFLTPEALDDTVNPETLAENVTAMVRFTGGTVFEVDDGQLIFAPAHSPAFWDAYEPGLGNLLDGEVDGWEPDENTKKTYF